ncbi:aspartate carbamoyltransferase catalytic subunit [Spiroplasma melliferum]|uniref:Aspartate carbamoyltransferase n=4 Tax=Spiroplasma melliferum TaxID=2134 RepID=A0AAI9T2W5_SPIME|nr:aspartate carbamoyltransferase catalytic subunit [Spiroplasma melliferum]KAI92511.1 aspartate carbamoyltransferase catalytic subunit [Spiroplasma melliferum KC3]QCO24097.1 aspartate carbamoyltransferase catalytic subunit [Spiroplasma melliferum]
MKNKSLFNLENWTEYDVHGILTTALQFKNNEKKVNYQQTKIVANLFFEPSTRTHYSFDVAAHKLGCKTLNFNELFSATKKGETLYDTVKTFEALGVDALVIRHPENNYYHQLANKIKIPILNGGDGSGNHPTQSLLDLLTIKEHFGEFKGLNIIIVGDIKYSRVAKTNIQIMQKLGMNVYTTWINELQLPGVTPVDFKATLPKMDVVMLLRYQFERFHADEKYHLDYLRNYKLTSELVATMKPTAIIMHPAPFNRGIEIDDDVVECQQAKIFEQMANGVFIRMALSSKGALPLSRSATFTPLSKVVRDKPSHHLTFFLNNIIFTTKNSVKVH